MLNVTVPSQSNHQRANHGSAALPSNANQDSRIAHQARQVERREARKKLKGTVPEPPVGKRPTPYKVGTMGEVQSFAAAKAAVPSLTKQSCVDRKSNEAFGQRGVDQVKAVEKPRWMPPVGGAR